MDKVNLVLRILLGLIFAVFGFNKLVPFLDPPPVTGGAEIFFNGLGQSGYFFTVLGIFETVSGLLLILNRYTALALAMLAPITINIFLFHVFLAPSGLMLAIPAIGLNAYLAYVNRDKYSGVLSAN